jgi:hypothetical protein
MMNVTREAIGLFDKIRTPIGPHLSKGIIILTFFEKREIKSLFGFISNQEKVCFERWRIHVIVNDRPIPKLVGAQTNADLRAIDMERRHLFDYARTQVQERILTILEVNDDSMKTRHCFYHHISFSRRQIELSITFHHQCTNMKLKRRVQRVNDVNNQL